MDKQKEVLLLQVIREFMLRHPRPWRIEQDWGWDVMDAKGARVTTTPAHELSQLLVDLAGDLDEEMKKDPVV